MVIFKNTILIYASWAIALVLGSCSPKEYTNFSFQKNSNNLSFVPIYPIESTNHCTDNSICISSLLDSLSDLYYVKYVDKVYDHFFMCHNDTLRIENMLYGDTTYYNLIPNTSWEFYETFIINISKQDQQFLYISMEDKVWHGPLRINLIFEIKKDSIKRSYGYGTLTFCDEEQPCMECITDFNHDGIIDFIKMPDTNEGTPIYYLNFINGNPRYFDSGYIRVWKRDRKTKEYLKQDVLVKKRFKNKYIIK